MASLNHVIYKQTFIFRYNGEQREYILSGQDSTFTMRQEGKVVELTTAQNTNYININYGNQKVNFTITVPFDPSPDSVYTFLFNRYQSIVEDFTQIETDLQIQYIVEGAVIDPVNSIANKYTKIAQFYNVIVARRPDIESSNSRQPVEREFEFDGIYQEIN